MTNYTLLSSKPMYELSEDEWYNEEYLTNRIEEQNKILNANGISNDGCKCYLVRFDNKEFYGVYTVDEAIQCLDLKNGCDLVQFENGLFGFVGYNNNLDTTKNRFEIIREANEEDF